MSNVVLRPPEINAVEGELIFLAGPIQGGPDWQEDAINHFDQLSSGLVIASPRKEYAFGEFVYGKQVDWETHHLKRAAQLGATMFWLATQMEETPGRSYAQTSRFELGESKMRHQEYGAKLVIGIEEGFGNSRYIRRRLAQDCPDVPILDSLEDTCQVTLELLET